MISVSQISNPGDAARYYTDQQKAAEYYSGEAIPSRWQGKAAEAMGLQGKVDADSLTNTLKGHIRDATGAREMGRARIDKETGERTREHRAGWDFTISAPKSVSIQALVHGDDKALQAHRTATTAALQYMERHGAQFRPDKDTYKQGACLAVATFEHVSSRACDPQLHTHALVANVTIDPETGKAYSLSNEKLFEHRRAADAVYHNTLARELEKAGHRVRFDKEGRVEIDHYKPSDLKEFSTRSQEIEKALAERGQTRASAGAEARQMAALATRRDKDLPETRAAHIDKWQAQAQALGITAASRERSTATRQPDAPAQAVDKAVAHLTERESVFTKAELHQTSLRFAQGAASIEQIEREIEKREKSGDLVQQQQGGHTARLTSKDALEIERDSDKRLQEGKGAHQAVMTPREFDAALKKFEDRKGFQLSEEQRSASRMILTNSDRFQGVQGLAGTGKTTMLEFVREAAESKGWTVTGHSNGAEQASVMQRESGIKTTTTARHLIDEHKMEALRAEHGVDPKCAPFKELRIMDEASMAGQRNFNDVLRTTEGSGARTVFLGDSRQHQSVEAGRAFERAQAHMPTAKLGEASIRRQTTDHMKSAVSQILAREEAKGLSQLKTVEIKTATQPNASREELRALRQQDNKQVVQRIAKDYAAMPAAERAKTLILTSTNNDRRAINSAVRDALRERGELSGQQREARILRAADMTRPESKVATNYQPGQIVEITNRDRETTRYSIERIDSRANVLHLRDEQGRERIIDPSQRGQGRITAYDTDRRDMTAGDRLRFTENHTLQDARGNEVEVRNGQTATIEKIDGDKLHLRMGDERVVADAKAMKADHDYAVTSYSAQGRTVDRVMIHHNTESGQHNSRETYVNVTRARADATVYTQDTGKMQQQSGIEQSKTAAHDIIPDKPQHEQPQPPRERESDLER